MRRSVFALFFALAASLTTLMPTQAQVSPVDPVIYHRNKVDLDNTTTDAWVWVTAYRSTMIGRQILRAWCVEPGRFEKRVVTTSGNTTVDYVRFEVEKKNCAHPVMLDHTFDFHTKPFRLTGSGGTYSIREE
jgi:hypothetical protein